MQGNETSEAIVDIAVWNRVQERRSKKRNTPAKRKGKKELNLFAGFVAYADCGGVLAATSKPGKTVEYHLLLRQVQQRRQKRLYRTYHPL